MKRHLRVLCASLLLLVPTAVRAASPEKNADRQAALEASERRAWDAFSKKDSTAFFKAMDMASVNIDNNGITDARSVVATMNDYAITNVTLDGFRMMPLDGDVLALMYVAHVTGTYKGQPIPDAPIYATTIYKKKGTTWIASLHQESMGMPATATGH